MAYGSLEITKGNFRIAINVLTAFEVREEREVACWFIHRITRS